MQQRASEQVETNKQGMEADGVLPCTPDPLRFVVAASLLASATFGIRSRGWKEKVGAVLTCTTQLTALYLVLHTYFRRE